METPRLRTPLRSKPLRLPGQSLDEAIDSHFWDELGPALLFAFILVVLAGFAWLTALTRVPPQPWLFTGFAVAASLYAAGKFARLRARFRRMVLGTAGEQVVTQDLEKVAADAAEVMRDVPAFGARAPRHHGKRSEACSLEPGQIRAQWQRAYWIGARHSSD